MNGYNTMFILYVIMFIMSLCFILLCFYYKLCLFLCMYTESNEKPESSSFHVYIYLSNEADSDSNKFCSLHHR